MSCKQPIIPTSYHKVFEIILVSLNEMHISRHVTTVPYNDPVAPKFMNCDTSFKWSWCYTELVWTQITPA